MVLWDARAQEGKQPQAAVPVLGSSEQPGPPHAYAPVTIARHWHAVIAMQVEAGATPVVQLGGSANLLHSAAGLSALQMISASRTDPALPVLVVGGAGGAWTAALLGPRVLHTTAPSAYPAVYYGGEDAATRQVCLLTWVDGLDSSVYTPHPKHYQAMDAGLLQHRHPGQTAGAEAIALTLAAGNVPAGLPPVADGRGVQSAGWSLPETATWIGWTALAAAVILPLLALFA